MSLRSAECYCCNKPSAVVKTVRWGTGRMADLDLCNICAPDGHDFMEHMRQIVAARDDGYRPERGLGDALRGDGPCSDCGTVENIVWFTESVFWNSVIRAPESRWSENEPILCINCFVREADRMGYKPTGWRLLPEWPWIRQTVRS